MKTKRAPNIKMLPMLACLSSLSACARTPKFEPTDEENKEIQTAIDSLELANELTANVVALADPEKLADKNGDDGTVEEFQEGITAAHQTVLDLWEDGRVFVYNAEDVPNPEQNFTETAAGFYGNDVDGNFIALKRGEFFVAHRLSEVLMHEGSHRFMRHTDTTEGLNERINDGETVSNNEWIMAAIESKDFPNELSQLFVPADNILFMAHHDIHSASARLREEARAGNWEEVQKIMEGYLNTEAGYSFLYSLENQQHPNGLGFMIDTDPYGIERNALRDMMIESRLYEQKVEQLQREVRETYQELIEAREATREIQRSRR